jgi:holo-[acyl-carrier protein] synthase
MRKPAFGLDVFRREGVDTNSSLKDPEAVGVRMGIDLVSVDLVEESIRVHADRYLERVFTERELADCQTGGGRVEAERLAARFAAKEATLKVLRPGDEGVPLTSIEVVTDPGGWVELALTGRAASIAESAGMHAFSVSLTHEGAFAAAVVAAECRGDERD